MRRIRTTRNELIFSISVVWTLFLSAALIYLLFA